MANVTQVVIDLGGGRLPHLGVRRLRTMAFLAISCNGSVLFYCAFAP
jgi:hypothetical protein